MPSVVPACRSFVARAPAPSQLPGLIRRPLSRLGRPVRATGPSPLAAGRIQPPGSSTPRNHARLFASGSQRVGSDGAARPSPSFRDGRVLVEGMSFSPIHLRDHCRSADDFHPVTHQRLLDTFALPGDIHPTDLHLDGDVLRVTWSHGGHQSSYPLSYLRSIAPAATSSEQVQLVPEEKQIWSDPTFYTDQNPSVPYSSLASDSPAGLLAALELLSAHGVVFISGVPPTPEATEALCRQLVGGRRLRETHYGQFWDFTADMAHGDLAYSNQALGAHTDGSYFVDPAGLQIFHLLAHPPPGTGGESLLVDGFTCAAALRAESPEDYGMLSRLKTSAIAAGSKGFLYHTAEGHPVFTHDQAGALVGVRWNNEDRAKLGGAAQGWSQADVDAWYRAARRWEGILRRKDHQVWAKLQPGTVVVIDNQRVMHGRAAFTGYRRMCGAYISKDEWRSQLAVLRADASRAEKGSPSPYALEY